MNDLAQTFSTSEDQDDRLSIRRPLKLQTVVVQTSAELQLGTLLDLSETGMLLEVPSPMTMAQAVTVDLPESGLTCATVVWASGNYAGCQFLEPLSRKAISASLLRAEPGSTAKGEFINQWNVAQEAKQDPESEKLSPRMRIGILVGSSAFLWTLIAAPLLRYFVF